MHKLNISIYIIHSHKCTGKCLIIIIIIIKNNNNKVEAILDWSGKKEDIYDHTLFGKELMLFNIIVVLVKCCHPSSYTV